MVKCCKVDSELRQNLNKSVHTPTHVTLLNLPRQQVEVRVELRNFPYTLIFAPTHIDTISHPYMQNPARRQLYVVYIEDHDHILKVNLPSHRQRQRPSNHDFQESCASLQGNMMRKWCQVRGMSNFHSNCYLPPSFSVRDSPQRSVINMGLFPTIFPPYYCLGPYDSMLTHPSRLTTYPMACHPSTTICCGPMSIDVWSASVRSFCLPQLQIVLTPRFLHTYRLYCVLYTR